MCSSDLDAELREVADEHADHELAEHRGLADALGRVAADFGGGKNDSEREDDERQRVDMGRSGRRLEERLAETESYAAVH